MRQSQATCRWITALAVPVLLVAGTAGWAQAPRFQDVAFYATPGITSNVMRDIDGDGVPDLILGKYSLPSTDVWLGAADGRFRLGAIAPVGYCVGLDVGRFNADAFADIACENMLYEVFVSLSSGPLTYDPPLYLGWNIFGVGGIQVRDCDADGHLDIAYPGGGWLGDGAGGFVPSLSCFPLAGVLGDVNEDGIPDLVHASSFFFYDYYLAVRLGLPGGGFGPILWGPELPYHTRVLAVGDLSGDGHLDALLVSPTDLMLSLGLGNGEFTPPVLSGQGPLFSMAVVGEYGLGRAEAVVLTVLTHEARFFVATASGDLSQTFSFSLPAAPQGLHSGDLNRDGVDDLVIPESSGFRVYLSQRSVLEVPTLSPVGLAALVCGLVLCALLLLRGRAGSRG